MHNSQNHGLVHIDANHPLVVREGAWLIILARSPKLIYLSPLLHAISHTHTNICTPTARTRAAYGHKDRLWYDGVLSCWFKVCVRAWCKVTVADRGW